MLGIGEDPPIRRGFAAISAAGRTNESDIRLSEERCFFARCESASQLHAIEDTTRAPLSPFGNRRQERHCSKRTTRQGTLGLISRLTTLAAP